MYDQEEDGYGDEQEMEGYGEEEMMPDDDDDQEMWNRKWINEH